MAKGKGAPQKQSNLQERATTLLSEQIGMCPGAEKIQHIVFDLINQKPIRFDMAFPAIGIITRKKVIAKNRGKPLFLLKGIDNAS